MENGTGRYVLYVLCALLPLLLYMLSNSFAVNEHAGATGRSLGQILADHPSFPVRFLLKSFAGILVGGEELQALVENGTLTNLGVYLLGTVCGFGVSFGPLAEPEAEAVRENLFPMMLLASGGMNHVLIFLSRYIFEKEDYAWSSLLRAAVSGGNPGDCIDLCPGGSHYFPEQEGLGGGDGVVLPCNPGRKWYTTYRELKKAPYREERFEQMARQAGDFSGMTDDKLADLYEYHKGRDKIEQAFEILKENHLNVFRDR